MIKQVRFLFWVIYSCIYSFQLCSVSPACFCSCLFFLSGYITVRCMSIRPGLLTHSVVCCTSWVCLTHRRSSHLFLPQTQTHTRVHHSTIPWQLFLSCTLAGWHPTHMPPIACPCRSACVCTYMHPTHLHPSACVILESPELTVLLSEWCQCVWINAIYYW